MTIKSNKIKTLVYALGLLCITGESEASVILTVSEGATGGVIIAGNGSFDLTEFTFDQDGTFTSPSQFGFSFSSGNRINGVDVVAELYDVPGADFTSGIVNLFESFRLDDNASGVGFSVSNNAFRIFSASNVDNNEGPTGIFDFDFVVSDTDGNIGDYRDGFIIWDSNGTDDLNDASTLGGQRVTLNVISVPEPSSTALLGLCSVALIMRRKRP